MLHSCLSIFFINVELDIDVSFYFPFSVLDPGKFKACKGFSLIICIFDKTLDSYDHKIV